MFINIFFILAALLTIGSTLAVVFTKNIIHACVYLLGTLIGVAGLYATLGADFVAATQLVVYVGGVVILMLFAVMLTGGKEFMSVNKFGVEKTPIMGDMKSYLIAGASALVMALVAGKIVFKYIKTYKTTLDIPYESTVERIGMSLVTDHVLAFEVSSVLLLGALVGAAIIARPRKG